jgi:hypothetical protein
MNEQEIFDTVVAHIFKQKHRAMGNVGCVYRNADGEKCAAGCLIPDEYYKPEMEKIFIDAIPKGMLPSWFREGKNMSVIRSLQRVHDQIESWRSTADMLTILDLVGRNHGLDTSGLKKLKKRKLDPVYLQSRDRLAPAPTIGKPDDDNGSTTE